METTSAKWLRILLGLFLIVYALNMFLHILPSGYGRMPEQAQVFIDAVAAHLPMLYILEIFIGLMLILNKWTSAILLVLFPLSIAFLIFTLSNWDLGDSIPGLIVAVLNVYLLLSRKEKYYSLFD